jgi:hypothetical protein
LASLTNIRLGSKREINTLGLYVAFSNKEKKVCNFNCKSRSTNKVLLSKSRFLASLSNIELGSSTLA